MRETDLGGLRVWSVVKILGSTSAIARTLNFTFSLKEKNFLSAGTVGAASLRKRLTGEKEWRILA